MTIRRSKVARALRTNLWATAGRWNVLAAIVTRSAVAARSADGSRRTRAWSYVAINFR